MRRAREEQSDLSQLPPELLEAQDLAMGTLGRIARFWGFTYNLGRVFGLLYLSRVPLTRDAIQKRLGISTGGAATALAELAEWGVAHRVWVRGDRRVHFQAETDFWRMVATVLNERERREVRSAMEQVERALALARLARRAARGDARDDVEFVVDRIQRLHSLYSLAQRLLDLLLTTLRVDITKYRALFR